jgi:hypothetical protein
MLGLAVLGVLVSGATATAGADKERVHLTAADNAAARAATLTRADLGGGWTQQATKPSVMPDSPDCPNYHPKKLDLLQTGAAKTKFVQPGVVVESSATLMKTAEMVRLDAQRVTLTPRFMQCMRYIAKKSETVHAKFVSIRPLKLPSFAPYAIGMRMTMDVTPKSGGKIRMISDIIEFGRGRTELTLQTTMPLEWVPTLFPNELVWAKELTGRIRA